MTTGKFVPIFSMKDWLAEDFRQIRRAILEGDVQRELNMVDLALYHAAGKLDPEEIEEIRSIYAPHAEAWMKARRDRDGSLEGKLHDALLKAQGAFIRALAKKGIGVWMDVGSEAIESPPLDFAEIEERLER